jgi:RHS repeat-associated protein
MASSTSVHSSAFNFLSFLQTGVDPRTGLYTVAIELPELKTNDLRGPDMPLSLRFNPLNNQDSGYGMGWNLQLSQYTPRNQILSLHTGETFKVTDSSANGQLTMRDKKIDSFHFYREQDRRYRVMHKSGLVEILETLDAGNTIALPTEIHAPSGHRLTLGYQPFGGGHFLLASITDASGAVLLRVLREPAGAQVEFLLYPDAGPDGTPLARFIMELQGSARQVARILLPTDNQASWRFSYDLVRDHLCITGVDTPTGGHEDIFYQDAGHQFPAGSGRPPLPRVTRSLTHPGFDQPLVDVRYTYPQDHNFLGFGLNLSWADDGYDNLFKHLGDYRYYSDETWWVADQPVRSVSRTFNQFHLLVDESTTEGNNRKTLENTYAYEPGKPYAQQPSDCQLPKEARTRWTLIDNPTRFRSESVLSRYDTHGNLIEQTQPTGVVEQSRWYSAAGEDGCPPDPEGFVRNLKEKIVIPAAGAQGQAPTLTTRYHYRALPALADSSLSEWLVVESETLSDMTQMLEQIRFEYLDEAADAFQHGRLASRVEIRSGRSTSTGYVYSKADGTDLAESVERVEETLTGFDGAVKLVTLENSLFTGDPLLNRDDNDVEIRYAYDNLRRVVRETVAPGTEFEASRVYEYTLCAETGDQARQTLFDVKQVRTVTSFDGLNRAILEERDNADSETAPDVLRQTYSAVYDPWDRLIEETVVDWLEDEQLALTSRFEYDHWGEQRCVIGPDGIKKIEETDPIGTTESAGPVRKAWSEGTAPGASSGQTVTWLNPFDKPVRVERLDRAEKRISLSETLYDGLGRSVRENVGFDTVQRVTEYEYDPFDRLTVTTLPGGAVVRRAYSVHSREDLPVSIDVESNDKIVRLGEQEFDGLDRLVRSVTGGREKHLEYEPGQSRPCVVTTPSGQTIGYDYRPQLGEEPLQRRLPLDVTADYQYDAQNARLLHCEEQGEGLTREYFSTGEIKREQRLTGAGDFTMHYRYSRLGRLLAYVDVQGQEQTCRYDTAGRLEQTQLTTVSCDIAYDELGRVSSTETADSANGQRLAVRLEYDDFGRETLRSFDGSGIRQQLAQTWDDVDDLSARVLSEGTNVLRDERFGYDGRGRLTNYECAGSQCPIDPRGKVIDRQIFTFDGLDNHTAVLTYFAESFNRARYFYEGPDPAQLSRVTNTHADYPGEIRLTYDDDGNLTSDEQGRVLKYDALGRLLEIGGGGGGAYHYDPLDNLSSRQDLGRDVQEQRFYRDDELACTLEGPKKKTFMRGADRLLAELHSEATDRSLLLAVDDSNTVLCDLEASGVHAYRYDAYGHPAIETEAVGSLGFNGELAEAGTGWQLLGAGYRAYNPVLMRFHSPDSLSPFGEGGLNGYAYCEGDPVNQVDPSGHVGWLSALRQIVGQAFQRISRAFRPLARVARPAARPAETAASTAQAPIRYQPWNESNDAWSFFMGRRLGPRGGLRPGTKDFKAVNNFIESSKAGRFWDDLSISGWVADGLQSKPRTPPVASAVQQLPSSRLSASYKQPLPTIPEEGLLIRSA